MRFRLTPPQSGRGTARWRDYFLVPILPPVPPNGSLTCMRDETIASFLTRLAARTAAPGGGATGALHAAQAAALLAMVARYSDGPRYDAEVVGRVRAAADGLADEAVDLAVADEAAFQKVVAAYQLP